MKIVFDVDEMKPACILLQIIMGGDQQAAHRFNPQYWLVHPTPGMKGFDLNEDQLDQLVKKVEERHPLKRMKTWRSLDQKVEQTNEK